MTSRSTFARIALGAATAAVALTTLLPVAASAQSPRNQSYDTQGGYYYNGCERAQNNRAVGGGLAGAVGGAVIGGNVASRHVRDEGAILGGVLGAIVGSQIGKSTAACDNGPRSSASYGYGYAPQAEAYPPQYDYYPAPTPQRGYERRARRGYAYGYGSNSDSDYDRSYGSDPQDCQMVESRVRLPDGRSQTRLVQACRDSHGDYQLVQ